MPGLEIPRAAPAGTREPHPGRSARAEASDDRPGLFPNHPEGSSTRRDTRTMQTSKMQNEMRVNITWRAARAAPELTSLVKPSPRCLPVERSLRRKPAMEDGRSRMGQARASPKASAGSQPLQVEDSASPWGGIQWIENNYTRHAYVCTH